MKQINEASLGRVLKHTKNKEIPFGIITAYRDGSNKNQAKINLKNNLELASKIKSEGYGYFFLDGHWVENQGKDDERDSAEKSIFIVGNKNDEGKLKKLLAKWNKEYNQDAAVYKPAGTDKVELLFQDGSGEYIGKFVPKKIAQAYSRLRNNQTFRFRTPKQKKEEAREVQKEKEKKAKVIRNAKKKISRKSRKDVKDKITKSKNESSNQNLVNRIDEMLNI